MRALAFATLLLLGASARAEDRASNARRGEAREVLPSEGGREGPPQEEPPTGVYEPPPLKDPPRWRVRGMIATGAGVAVGGVRYASFPTTLELGARVWGPLSVSVSGAAILASREVTRCGASLRPNAGIGGVGLRANLNNGRSASWVDPFVEAHVGVGGQAAFSEEGEACSGPRIFATGGGRIGLDAWLGPVAVTAAFSYDYLPVGSPLAISLGASVILR